MNSKLRCFAITLVVAGALLSTGCGSSSSGSPAPAAAPDHLVVYYFHGNVRCPTCGLIETYAHEAVTSGFGDELKNGRIEWKVANFETPENESLAKEFSLQASSIVLVAFKDGQRQAWKDLSEVWQRVDNKADFVAYVQQETRTFLDGKTRG